MKRGVTPAGFIVAVITACVGVFGILGCFGQPYRSSAGLGVPAVNDYCEVRLDYSCIVSENKPDPKGGKDHDSSGTSLHQIVFCKRIDAQTFQIPTISHGSTRGSDYNRHENEIVQIEAETLGSESPLGVEIPRIDTIRKMTVIPDQRKEIDRNYFQKHKHMPGSYVLLSNRAVMSIRSGQDACDRTLYSIVGWHQCIDGLVQTKSGFNKHVFSMHGRSFKDLIDNNEYFRGGSIRSVEIHRVGGKFYIPCIVHVGDYLRDKVYIEIVIKDNGHQDITLGWLMDEQNIDKARFIDRNDNRLKSAEKITVEYGNERRRVSAFLSRCEDAYRPWSRNGIKIYRPE